MAELEARRLLYILGVRERTERRCASSCSMIPSHSCSCSSASAASKSMNEVKAVMLAWRRHVVCRNYPEAEKDAAERFNRPPSSANSPRATSRWSATRTFGANSGPSETITSRSTSPRSRGSEVRRHFRAAHQHCSTRPRRCSATNSYGPWSRSFVAPSSCSRPADRSIAG